MLTTVGIEPTAFRIPTHLHIDIVRTETFILNSFDSVVDSEENLISWHFVLLIIAGMEPKIFGMLVQSLMLCQLQSYAVRLFRVMRYFEAEYSLYDINVI